jgi:lon-related putative ATP-dependent protease
MPVPIPLPPDQLYRTCAAELLDFETTAELSDIDAAYGQDRAVEAIEFGVRMRAAGYNLFLLGPRQVEKQEILRRVLQQTGRDGRQVWDWCYTNNFADAERPNLLRLPVGRGSELQQAMRKLVETLRTSIPAAFESEEYRRRRSRIEGELQQRQARALREIGDDAERQGLALLQTPHGFTIMPVRDGKPLPPEEFEKLPEPERQRILNTVPGLHQRLGAVIEQFPVWFKEHREKEQQLDRETTMAAVGLQIEALRKQSQDLPAVLEYLDAVEDDLVENAHRFRERDEPLLSMLPTAARLQRHFASRYEVNLLVGHAPDEDFPIIYEDHPTHTNLIGQVGHLSQLGALVTDFTLIRPGALHRANGGYLILDAERVLLQPYAWQALKRALHERQVRLESVGELLGLVSTVSLEPEPMPLDLKVVLLGDRLLYYLLCEFDEEFSELFKVAVDFEDRLDRSPESVPLYARLLATLARKHEVRPLHRGAVARLIEESARQASATSKLSLHLRRLTDLLREADARAAHARRDTVLAEDVQTAIDQRIRRLERPRRELQEAIQRDVLLISTVGEAIGQVNGISVADAGGFAFGHPVRITATARLGKGEVIDIQREVELGGPIHSKGVLILASYLGSRFGSTLPLSLHASLVFEQTYGTVEGDSASVAEACALLSALARTPIRQSLAVTGSMNQYGRVQAVGGINEKVEGIFDLCKARGLAGEYGVLIPADNVQHLMLRAEVVQAAREGTFRVFPIRTVDEAVSVLTGVEAGERDYTGRYAFDTLNHRVEMRLTELARARLAFAKEEEAGV